MTATKCRIFTLIMANMKRYGELLAGDFPRKQAAYVKAWALLHEDDLKANWQLALNGEETFRIEPLC